MIDNSVKYRGCQIVVHKYKSLFFAQVYSPSGRFKVQTDKSAKKSIVIDNAMDIIDDFLIHKEVQYEKENL